MGGWIAAVLILTSYAGQTVRPPRPVFKPRTASAVTLPLAGQTINVSPAAINFQAVDPDGPPVAGDSLATVWWTYNGQNKTTWNLTVQAQSNTLANCPGIPISAITVTCSSVNVTKNGSGSCSGAFPLSASPVVVAGGTESTPNATYTIRIGYTLTDTWRQFAQQSPSCSLSLTYTATLP